LHWDGARMEFTNIGDNEMVRIDRNTEVPAKKFAADLINHPYRDGWTLPEMPV